MPITIPVEVHPVTIQIMGTGAQYNTVVSSIDQGLTAEEMDAALRRATQLWSPDFQFTRASFEPDSTDLPSNATVVGNNEKWFLYGRYPSRRGISLIVVHQVGRAVELQAGFSVAERAITIVGHSAAPDSFGPTIAHEFGHLLSLGHNDRDRSNLMHPSDYGTNLMGNQRSQARNSALARRFGAPGGPRP